jgi:hypothetical protein
LGYAAETSPCWQRRKERERAMHPSSLEKAFQLGTGMIVQMKKIQYYSFIFSYNLAAHIYIQPFLSNAAEISACWQRRTKREKCIKEA